MTGRGLTLLEVLVALFVASIAIASLATTSRAALEGGRQAARLDAATLLASAALEERLARPPKALAAGTESETILAAGASFTRKVTLSAGPRPDLWRITVAVRDRHGEAVGLTTLRRVAWRPAP